MQRRVLITGLGTISSIGMNIEETLDSLLNKRSGIKKSKNLQSVHKDDFVFGEVPLTLSELKDMLNIPQHEAYSRTSLLAMLAAKEAVEDSGIFSNDSTAEQVRMRTGVSIGSGFGGLSDIEREVIDSTRYNDSQWREECIKRGRKRDSEKRGLQRMDEFTALKTLPGGPSSYVSGYYQLHAGGSVSGSAECGTGLATIIMGCKDIQLGYADAYICGGTGDAFSFLTFGGFDILGALSPTGVSRPFDRNRNGFVIGDGAGIVVIERLEHAHSNQFRSSDSEAFDICQK